MEIIMIRSNIEEEREATMARFLHGLNQDIANLVDLEHYVELEDMVHMTMKVEQRLKKKGSTRTNLGSSSSWKSKGRKDEKATVDMCGRDDKRARRIDSDLGSIKLKRRRNRERPINTWEEMKAIMKRRFVPTHYYRELHQRLQSLTQSSRSVEDYHKEMEIIMIRANIEEEREATMARFLHGLNQDIANLVDLEHYVKLEDMVHMTVKVEQRLKKKGSTRTNLGSSSSWKSKWSKDKKRAMILRDDGDVETESESDDDPMPLLEDANDGVEYLVDGKLMVARRALNMQVKEDAETAAVQHLKKITQYPFPLKIPTEGQRILQTDASDEYWGAVLLEKRDGKEAYCAHASGQFKESKKHYHVIYKEIVAVKYGIQKFEFHLIGHNFLIRLDNSSFPKILDLKNKTLLDKHLLRLKTWFSKYDFSVQHIKGDQNLIPDLLSRPPSSATFTLISSSITVAVIFMNSSFFQWETRSVGISRVTYCSDCVA
ncbi:hypothetical protein KPL71_026421 [Citrus sinensis]|uniref:Uncharacterized protein n=1 Tax=Citrus sinensis TaxID=2711 RepID=A0ACB8HZ66_CITSI|nr:hypothetical protein KPL71_026421 [Citrus sinensis]